MALTDPLVLSKLGKAMNKPLSEIQLALVTETVAGCTVQGLGRLKECLATNKNPAMTSSVLQDVF